ncbi:hypothetical protein ACFQ6S_06190 [Streptomyces sp. NPDC056479]|uniref:hypothetical protein n=1 Tax=Streptomyces sp. NPDC056479 TaxID=3345832 RepID=UPI0036762046
MVMKSRQPLLVTAAVLLPAALLTGTTAYSADLPPPTVTAPITSGAPFWSASAPEAVPAAQSPSPTMSGPASPSQTASPSTSLPRWTEEDCELYEYRRGDQGLRLTLSGLPADITAGSRWHDFAMRVENLTDTTFDDLFFVLLRNAVDRMDDPDEMYSAAWSPKGARLQPQPPRTNRNTACASWCAQSWPLSH